MQRRLMRLAVAFAMVVTTTSGGAAPASEELFVDIPLHDSERLKKILGEDALDVVGVDRKRGLVRLHVDSDQYRRAIAAGFRFLGSERFVEFEKAVSSAYHSPEAMKAELTALAARSPDLLRLREYGRSIEDRALVAVEIDPRPDDVRKPVVFFDSQIHAREVMTSEVTLHMIKSLVDGYGRDAELTRWMDAFRIVVVPQVNPDGVGYVFGGKTSWRKNTRRTNGRIVGIDLNRNFTFDWGACQGSSGVPSSDTYRGPEAGSEPEVQALMALVRNLRPVASITYHSTSEIIVTPYGCRGRNLEDKFFFDLLGRRMSAGIVDDAGRTGTYEVGAPPEVIYEADGGSIDWQWREEGVLAFGIEVNSMNTGQQPSNPRLRDLTVERQRGGWMSLLRSMERHGVRAMVRATDASEVTFRFVRAGSATDVSPVPRRLRNADGLLFEALSPGSYRLEFLRMGGVVFSRELSLPEGNIFDLGEIVIP